MKASLSQILASFLVLSSVFGLAASTSSGPIVWNENFLPYEVPKLPSQFDENGRKPPYFVIGTFSPATRFENGTQMFRLEHQFGWQRCREKYYRTGEFEQCWDDYSINSLDPDEWSTEHMLTARATGYRKCREQIENVGGSSRMVLIRRQMGYSNFWRVVPAFVIGVIGVTMMVRFKPTAKRGITKR